MILVFAKVKVLPHKVEEYEAIVRDSLPKVKADEPGVLGYDCGRSRDEPFTYRIIEIYRDQAAIDVHMNSKHLAAAMPAMLACIDGEIEFGMHDSI